VRLKVKHRALPRPWDRLDDFELWARKFMDGSSVGQVISKIRLRQVEEMWRKIVLSWTSGYPLIWTVCQSSLTDSLEQRYFTHGPRSVSPTP
jgi:hypothetical protein